jgi:hypothetical protein
VKAGNVEGHGKTPKGAEEPVKGFFRDFTSDAASDSMES